MNNGSRFPFRREGDERISSGNAGIHVQFRLDVFARKALFRVNRFFPPFNRERERERKFVSLDKIATLDGILNDIATTDVSKEFERSLFFFARSPLNYSNY